MKTQLKPEEIEKLKEVVKTFLKEKTLVGTLYLWKDTNTRFVLFDCYVGEESEELQVLEIEQCGIDLLNVSETNP